MTGLASRDPESRTVPYTEGPWFISVVTLLCVLCREGIPENISYSISSSAAVHGLIWLSPKAR